MAAATRSRIRVARTRHFRISAKRARPGKKVVDDNPARYAEPIELGGTHNRIGWLLFGMGHMDEALEEFEAARMVFQKLIDSNPPHHVHRTRSELATS